MDWIWVFITACLGLGLAGLHVSRLIEGMSEREQWYHVGVWLPGAALFGGLIGFVLTWAFTGRVLLDPSEPYQAAALILGALVVIGASAIALRNRPVGDTG